MSEVIALPSVDPETELLIAFRDYIRARCGLSNNDCDIEYDEYIPPTQGHAYIVITPGGLQLGDQHSPASNREDLKYTIEILVCLRIANVPPDRQRNAFTIRSGSINKRLRQVMLAVGNGYEITNAANLALEAGSDRGRFVEPPEFKGIDPKPREGNGETTVMARGIKYGGARFMRKW